MAAIAVRPTNYLVLKPMKLIGTTPRPISLQKIRQLVVL